MVKEKNSLFGFTTFITILVAGSVVFGMGIVRGKCINKGYELSNMAKEIEERRVKIERVEKRRSSLVNKEKLFIVAGEKGFVMMSEGKTFNVQ